MDLTEKNLSEKKLKSISSALELITNELNLINSKNEEKRNTISEPFRFFADVLLILLMNSQFISYSEDSEMDSEYLIEKISKKFKFTALDLKRDKNGFLNWHKSFYQSINYLQDMKYISIFKLEDSVSKFNIEITLSGARALKNYSADRKPIYFRHAESEIAVKIIDDYYEFYDPKTLEKIKIEYSSDIERFRKSLMDSLRYVAFKLPKINKKKGQLKLK